MKRIYLLFLLALVPALSWAQNNFFIEDNSLVWRKVYNNSTDVETIAYQLLHDGHFKEIESSDNLVTAELRNLEIDYSGAGVKRMSLPIYIPNNTFYGFVTIQIKEGRYRVTIERMVGRGSRLGPVNMNNMTLENGGFDDKFLGQPAMVFDYTFDKVFSKLSNKQDDEW